LRAKKDTNKEHRQMEEQLIQVQTANDIFYA
jgi:hypothetical protein